MRYCMSDKVKIVIELQSLKDSRKQNCACAHAVLQICMSNSNRIEFTRRTFNLFVHSQVLLSLFLPLTERMALLS